ncbi:hypothetical protein E4U10_000777 [Claviceps purpurea]|nr:hypothetical protein E4U37_006244 [Claviceps purpurea]KAG6169107.1 hypothetical protein E4U51_001728 [Claviceps purpurea]KAG6181057.1 hypothetical protein E4U36_004365 [Claviceps purpurea]KAG6196673.1 hypothetical protein E4U10_000777 [Claviceps purpurea]KAG6267592.1 hypothetical protein E4U49_007967 [Claviceps purpurea]
MAHNTDHSRPTMSSQLSSHGRGGAGNMADASKSPKLNTSDLETPLLKKPVVTTGRGGTGNMAKNDDPQATRLRQDVEAVPRRYSSGAQHTGRGGAGNVFRESEELTDLARQTSREDAIVDNASSTEGDAAVAKRKHWPFGKKA